MERWVARKRKTSSCAPLPDAGGPARKLATAEAAIRAAVKAQPELTLQELCEAVEQETKIKSDPSMMYRELVRLQLPRKKVTPLLGCLLAVALGMVVFQVVLATHEIHSRLLSDLLAPETIND